MSDDTFYLADINATLEIHDNLTRVMSNLLDERYESVWKAINPLGNDFVRLLTCHQRITHIVEQILSTDCQQFPGCLWTVNTLNINQTIRILHRQQLETFSFENESTRTKLTISGARKTHQNNKTTFHIEDKSNGSSIYSLLFLSFYFRFQFRRGSQFQSAHSAPLINTFQIFD